MIAKIFWILSAAVLCADNAVAQHNPKPMVDENAIMNWEMINPGISGELTGINEEGSYIYYYLDKAWQGSATLVIQATEGNQKYEYSRATDAMFADNGKLCFFMLGDTLNMLNLHTGKLERTPGVSGLKLIGSVLLFHQQSKEKVLVIKDLSTNREVCLNGVESYALDPAERFVALRRKNPEKLTVLDLMNGEETPIWTGKDDATILTVIINKQSSKLSFMVQEKGNNAVWVYDRNSQKTKLLVSEGPSLLPNGRQIGTSLQFSMDGEFVYFSLAPLTYEKAGADAVKVDVWNFKDKVLQDIQLQTSPDRLATTLWYAVDIQTDRILPLNRAGEQVVFFPMINYVMVREEIQGRYWENTNYDKNRTDVDKLVSLTDGSRVEIPVVKGIRVYYPSADGNYLFIWGGEEGNERGYSFSPSTGKFVVLTEHLPARLFASDSAEGGASLSVAGWMLNEQAVMVYDRFDIWKLDLTGKNLPVNLTGGYGRQNHIKLRFSNTDTKDRTFSKTGQYLLTAFNARNKDNGFYRLNLGKPGKPDSLSMRPWITDFTADNLGFANDWMYIKGFAPKRAGNNNLWLVMGKSATDAPNFFLTKDLKTYQRLTDYQPHKDVNWYTSTLAEWKQDNGKIVHGILYKPENFDPKKTYPVVISHYRMFSHCLNEFRRPYFTESGFIDVPWFVSRGYLVLMPDVYVAKDGSGPSALRVTASGAKWLASLPFVDENRIGLAGHSQAGFQANYISANSNVFAAIFAGAGGADMLSSIFDMSNNNIGLYPARMAPSTPFRGLPSDSVASYIKLSPMYRADQMNTPLLLYHCKKDSAVPYHLSVQYFMALWRLNKPVWLLQYDEGSHVQRNLRDAKDLTIRVNQFFDHYLKDAPAPVWMTRGVPAYKKGVETGLELDPEGSKALPKNPYLVN